MALITLNYDIDVGVQSASALLSRIGALTIDRGELAILGSMLSDQIAVLDATTLRRTVAIETSVQGDEDFPTVAALEAATVNLYRATLNILSPARVTAAAPVVELQTPLDVPGLAGWFRPDIGLIVLGDGSLSLWSGANGGGFTPDVTSDATLVLSDPDWNNYPSISTSAGFLTSDLAAAFWKYLHDGSGSTMIYTVRPTAGVAPILAATTDGGAATSGIQVGVAAGAWVWSVLRGGAPPAIQSIIGASYALNANVWLAMRFEEGRPGNEYAFNIDGVLEDSGNTAAAPSAADPFEALNIFGDPSGVSFEGTGTDQMFFNRYITDAELAYIENYLTNRYGAF